MTSVARRPESLAYAAASLYVITADEIRRSGATSIPEALRLAPNLDVARVDSNQYAISARGFNNVLANKLLVLIDGRTVYTPLFSGVFWEAQDVLLADIERIEVISGPGGDAVGRERGERRDQHHHAHRPATRRARSSYAGGGNQRIAARRARHGGALGDDGDYRALREVFPSRRHRSCRTARRSRDDAERHAGGFRGDLGTPASGADAAGRRVLAPTSTRPRRAATSAAATCSRASSRAFDDGGTLRVQAYYDHTYREHVQQFKERLDTVDLEAQYGQRVLGNQQVLVGARIPATRATGWATLRSQAFLPAETTQSWSNVFLQDEIALDDRLDADRRREGRSATTTRAPSSCPACGSAGA